MTAGYNGRISIHAPRVGSDHIPGSGRSDQRDFNPRSPCGERQPFHHLFISTQEFQSTLPVWGATAAPFLRHHKPAISIHAPRVGSDRTARWFFFAVQYFNPRSPCGERPLLPVLSTFCVFLFQSTLPVWGATGVTRIFFGIFAISIHAPRVGSDRAVIAQTQGTLEFQSTLPVWGAT